MEKINTNTLSADPQRAKELGLKPRQVEAAIWVAEGKTDQEIGPILGITPRTAKFHVLTAMEQTDTHTRAQLVAHLFVHGVFSAGNQIRMLIFVLVLGVTWSSAPVSQLLATVSDLVSQPLEDDKKDHHDQDFARRVQRNTPRRGNRFNSRSRNKSTA